MAEQGPIVFCTGGGCTAKLGAGVLSRILKKLPRGEKDPDLLVGYDSRDDAAVYRITDDKKATDLADSLLKSYQERNASLREELGLMAYRASLTGQYSEEESGIVDLLVQKRQQEADALAFMQKQIDAKMDATLAEKEYEAELLLINDIHQMNLDLLLDQIQAHPERDWSAARRRIATLNHLIAQENTASAP